MFAEGAQPEERPGQPYYDKLIHDSIFDSMDELPFNMDEFLQFPEDSDTKVGELPGSALPPNQLPYNNGYTVPCAAFLDTPITDNNICIQESACVADTGPTSVLFGYLDSANHAAVVSNSIPAIPDIPTGNSSSDSSVDTDFESAVYDSTEVHHNSNFGSGFDVGFLCGLNAALGNLRADACPPNDLGQIGQSFKTTDADQATSFQETESPHPLTKLSTSAAPAPKNRRFKIKAVPEDLCFSFVLDGRIEKRKRDRQDEITHMRKIGACFRCKFLKLRVGAATLNSRPPSCTYTSSVLGELPASNVSKR